MKPEEAKPIVYGMNTQGGDRVTTIGAKTEYPDLCMEIINYFATPEGRMIYQYGPKGETYNSDNWKSNVKTPEYKIQQDWVDKTGCKNLNEYMEKGGNYVVAPATSYSASAKDDELKTTWAQVTTSIKENSWKAIYAKTDAEYNKCVQKMKKDTAAYGYDKCLKWCENEAATRRSLEKADRKSVV